MHDAFSTRMVGSPTSVSTPIIHHTVQGVVGGMEEERSRGSRASTRKARMVRSSVFLPSVGMPWRSLLPPSALSSTGEFNLDAIRSLLAHTNETPE